MASRSYSSLSEPVETHFDMPKLRDLRLIFSRDGHGRFGEDDAVFLMVDDVARQCVALLAVNEQINSLEGMFEPVTFAASNLVEGQTTVEGAELWNRAYAYMSNSQFVVTSEEATPTKWQIEIRGGFIDTPAPLQPERSAHEKAEIIRTKQHLF